MGVEVKLLQTTTENTNRDAVSFAFLIRFSAAIRDGQIAVCKYKHWPRIRVQAGSIKMAPIGEPNPPQCPLIGRQSLIKLVLSAPMKALMG
ncbi:MAG: hypothetical protein WBF54_06655 [Terriglobales bacterium]